MSYEHLSVDDRCQIVAGQVKELETNLFEQQLNLARLEAEDRVGGDVAEAIASVQRAIETLGRAIETTAAEGDKLGANGNRPAGR